MPRGKAQNINKQEAMSLLDSGQSRRDVAEKYGVSLVTLVKHLGLAKARGPRNENGSGSPASENPNAGVTFDARRFTETSARQILAELESQKTVLETTLESVNEQIDKVGELVA